MAAPIVILGSGLAGTSVVRELRKLNPDIPITLVSADHGGFYSKPMLSNALAQNKAPAQLLVTPAEKLAEQLKITLQAHTRVTSIDVAGKKLVTEQGDIDYSVLVLAIGAHPIRLPIQGDGAADVLSVNSLDDYIVFRERLQPGMDVAILGAGLIGCEFANDLVLAGYGVSVFDLANQPLGRLLPPGAGAFLRQRLVDSGIAFHFGTAISTIGKKKGGSGYLLASNDGREFEADLVLSAVGLVPATALAKEAGLDVKRGIVVNRLLQTSAADIYALGDCAEVGGLVLPFVLPIMNAARALAKTLNGDATELVYPAMPVGVKTPACPTVVSPPAMGTEGSWEEEEIDNGLRALFKAPDGTLLGAALLGEAAKEKQTLAAQLPPVLG